MAVPAAVKNYGRKLELIAQYEQDSPEAAMKLSGAKKSLANGTGRDKETGEGSLFSVYRDVPRTHVFTPPLTIPLLNLP